MLSYFIVQIYYQTHYTDILGEPKFIMKCSMFIETSNIYSEIYSILLYPIVNILCANKRFT